MRTRSSWRATSTLTALDRVLGSHGAAIVRADGTPLAAEKIERVLTNDPGTGVMRHVDAGYDRADEVAHDRGVRIPMEEA